MTEVSDAYLVLQVDPSADMIVIQAAYRALARRYHPDGETPDAHRMADLNAAYHILRDPDSRRRHDTERVARAAQPVRIEPAESAPRNRWAPGPGTGTEHAVLDFGRYMGWRISDLARHDPDYLRWLCRHSSGIRFRDAIARALPREPELQRRPSFVA